jgi:hypothetical protein
MISKNNLIYYFILIILIIILIRRFSFLNIENFTNEDDEIKKLIYKHNLVLTRLKKKINKNIVKNINRKKNRDKAKTSVIARDRSKVRASFKVRDRDRDKDRDRARAKTRDKTIDKTRDRDKTRGKDRVRGRVRGRDSIRGRDRKNRDKHINHVYNSIDDIQINTYNETPFVPIKYQNPVYTREDNVLNDNLYHTFGGKHARNTYDNVDDIQTNTNSETPFGPIPPIAPNASIAAIAPIAYQDPVYMRDTRVLNDKLYPPLGRTERPQFDLMMRYFNDPNGVFNAHTRGPPDTFRQIGYLTPTDGKQTIDTILILYARAKYPNSDVADFFVTSSNKISDLKIPITQNNSNIRRITDIPNNVIITGNILNGSYQYTELPKSDLTYPYL